MLTVHTWLVATILALCPLLNVGAIAVNKIKKVLSLGKVPLAREMDNAQHT